jgi:hypothetical protein
MAARIKIKNKTKILKLPKEAKTPAAKSKESLVKMG